MSPPRPRAAEKGGSKSRPGITTDDIRAAAIEAFSQKGYRGTNLKDVADELGVTRQAIYYHYTNKHALLFEMFEFFFAELQHGIDEVKKAESDPAARFEQMLRSHVLRVIASADLTSIFTREYEALDADAKARVRRWRNRYQHEFVAAYEDLVAAGGAKPLPPGPTMSLIFGAANWTFRWYNGRRPTMSPDDLVALLLSLVRDGYAPDPA